MGWSWPTILANGAPVGYYSLELLLSSEISASRGGPQAQERTLSQRRAVRDRAGCRSRAPAGRRQRARPRPRRTRAERAARSPRAASQRAAPGTTSSGWPKIGASCSTRAAWATGPGIRGHRARRRPSWPAPWVLVIHTRYAAESSPYVERLRAQAASRARLFSLKPVDRPGVRRFDRRRRRRPGLLRRVRRLVVYADQYPDDRGLSSGKLAYYLRAGLPVIVNRAASIGDASRQPGVAWPSEMRQELARRSIRSRSTTSASAPVPAQFSTSTWFFRAVLREVDRTRGATGGARDRDRRADDGQVLAYFIRAGALPDQTRFTTHLRLQPAGRPGGLPAGGEIARHVPARSNGTSSAPTEVTAGPAGRCEVDVFSADRQLRRPRAMGVGDIVIAVGGGHGFGRSKTWCCWRSSKGLYPGGAEKERF